MTGVSAGQPYGGDTVDWNTVMRADKWLDAGVGPDYQAQPLAQDWARISKINEELGEAIAELILVTGQNPRKPRPEFSSYADVTAELADVWLTALLAIQHFTKNSYTTRGILLDVLNKLKDRVPSSIS